MSDWDEETRMSAPEQMVAWRDARDEESLWRAAFAVSVVPRGCKLEQETYVRLSKVRERLLSPEVIEAIAAEIARFRTFKPADEWLREDEEEAISKALAAAFPPQEPGEEE